MRAFLEKNEKEWFDDFIYAANLPLKNLGVEVIPFNGNDLNPFFNKYTFDIKTDIMIASVNVTNLFFMSCGLEIPKYLGYPESLHGFLGREIQRCKLSEINMGYPYFVKPAVDVKMFTGTLVENDKQLQMLKDYYGVKDETEVYLSEPVKFISEYRCFVHDGELVGIQWYKGDFRVFPKASVIEYMIECYKDAPVAYTLDVGVYESGDTALIEVNDFWAIGSYGLAGDIYVKMAIDRMRQIGGLPTRKQINEGIY